MKHDTYIGLIIWPLGLDTMIFNSTIVHMTLNIKNYRFVKKVLKVCI